MKSQQRDPPTRNEFVFHVYVDPLHGDDTYATAYNPSVNHADPARRPLAYHPEGTGPTTWKIGGVLQHAPYPFKTLTGASGVQAWLATNFFPVTTPPSTLLPWTNPQTQKVVRHILIHCRPGLYGPTDVGARDPISDLPFNGENWPFTLRSNVSIQGTSALDTILDARGKTVSIIHVNESATSGNGESHEESFIDSLSLRGARAVPEEQQAAYPPAGEGAAIFLLNVVPNGVGDRVNVKISNCYIYDNTVGIGINGWEPFGNQTVPHKAKVINNTIAWNRCGVWASRWPLNGGAIAANHLCSYANNIFDSGSPAGFIAGISGFEGIHAPELLVLSIGGQPLAGGQGQDFNAWELSPTSTPFVNTQQSIAANWPSVPLWLAPVPFPTPRVNIAPYTKAPSGRGSLYVNDILRRAPPQVVPPGYDYSSHDFRLSPTVSLDNLAPTIANPLVNQGLDIDNITKFPVLWFNPAPSQGLPSYPGLPPGAENCPVHAWDWDGEGFGNPRVVQHPAFSPGLIAFQSGSMSSYMDIGADELGTLIIAGYVPNTRMFYAHPIPGQQSFYNQISIVFFQPVGLTSHPRPCTNLIIGGRVSSLAPATPGFYSWMSHKIGGLDASVGNYTDMSYPVWNLALDPGRHLFMSSGFNPPPPPPANPGPHESVPRSLESDFGGGLLPDLHPRWPTSTSINSPGGNQRDEYACNPWYAHSQPLFPGYFTRDNPAFYHNVGATNSPHSVFSFTWTSVLDATTCPPGAILAGPTFVDSGAPFVFIPFGPFTPCSGGGTYNVGVWGYGASAAGCPDIAPYSSLAESLGVRWNCQVSSTGACSLPLDGVGNLQTFLTITTNQGLPGQPESTLRISGDLPRHGDSRELQREEFLGRLWRLSQRR